MGTPKGYAHFDISKLLNNAKGYYKVGANDGSSRKDSLLITKVIEVHFVRLIPRFTRKEAFGSHNMGIWPYTKVKLKPRINVHQMPFYFYTLVYVLIPGLTLKPRFRGVNLGIRLKPRFMTIFLSYSSKT